MGASCFSFFCELKIYSVDSVDDRRYTEITPKRVRWITAILCKEEVILLEVNVIVEQSVVEKINTMFYRFPDMETGGQLVGNIGRDAITDAYTVYVADLYHEISQVGSSIGFSFESAYQSRAYLWCDQKYGEKYHLIGNVHSHAGSPAFWSTMDKKMMRQVRGEALYIVASPGEHSWLFRFKDDGVNFCDNCRVTIADSRAVETAVGKELIASPYTRPGGAGAIQYTAIPHYNMAQQKESAKHLDYSVEVLHEKRVLMVGAGAVGNLILESLVHSGVGHITVVDNDSYQIANLPQNPLVDRRAVGKPKAYELARAAAEKACFTLNITGVQADICTLGFAFLKGFNLVISAVDSMAVRQFIDRGCKIYNVAHISAETEMCCDNFLGNVMFSPPNVRVDYEQLFGTDWRASEEKKRSYSSADSTRPQPLTFSSRAAGLAADLSIKWLLGRMKDKDCVRKYVINSVGQTVQADADSSQLCTYGEPSEAVQAESELFSRLGKKPIHSIRFDRNHPKSGLFHLFCRAFGDDSEAYTLDLEGLAMLLPVVYCRDSITSISVIDVDEVDETLFRLPPEHLYSVFTENNEYLVELTFEDAV